MVDITKQLNTLVLTCAMLPALSVTNDDTFAAGSIYVSSLSRFSTSDVVI